MKKIILMLTFIFFNTTGFAATDRYPFANAAQAKQFAEITYATRCVVCQNQNLADSNAPLANDLREKIYVMVQENKSTADIKNYLVKRYGNFILLQPPFALNTLVLWLSPLAMLAFSMVFFLRFKWRNKQL